MELTHLSLFSGIGGMDIAAEWAGFKTVGQCEYAEYPAGVLKKHWPDVERWSDIHGLSADEFFKRTGIGKGMLTCISGGFPCQPHSLAGMRKASGDERDLWPEFRRVVGEIKPRWVVADTPFSRQEYIEAYGQTMDPVERARKFAVKCWMGFGCGNLYRNGFKSGQQAHSPNPAKSWAGLPETMELAAERLRGVQIECLPALELIKRYDTPDVLIYADPPYLHGTRKNYLYRHEMTDEEHKELLKIPDFILTRVEAIKASSTKTSSRLI